MRVGPDRPTEPINPWAHPSRYPAPLAPTATALGVAGDRALGTAVAVGGTGPAPVPETAAPTPGLAEC